MSRATGATGPAGSAGDADAFAGLLRELKERSGLSYGALAQRLHMSTSTLHRYCNGSALPADYAPVERLARVCRATPVELVELHRRWILADAARGRKGPASDGAARAAGAAKPEAGQPASARAETAHPETAQGRADPEGKASQRADGADPASTGGALHGSAGSEAPVVSGAVPSAPVPPHRRRTALIAATAAAVLGAVVLAVSLPSSDDGHEQPAAGDVTATDASSGPTDDERPSVSDSPSPSRSTKAGGPAASSSESAAPDGGEADQPSEGGDVPVNVATRPYVYEGPCSQHFLVNDSPEHIGPPANEPDAPRWAAAYGAVSSGEQRVALTLQGAGEETVVLEELHVRVVTKSAPLAWNDYAMGSGCGGDVSTKSFDVDLDNGSPSVSVKNGQRDFPYKVSESDPEVFYVTAHTKAHDVRWDLTLDWSSGDRRGTVHIDNKGTPFRTSGDAGRPSYHYPLGGSEWIERQD